MSANSGFRRITISGVAAAVLASTMAIAAPATAAPLATATFTTKAKPATGLASAASRRGGGIRDSSLAGERARSLPAPPRPSSAKPVARVVAKADRVGPATRRAAGEASARVSTASTVFGATVYAASTPPAGSKSGAGAPGAGSARTLVVYDSTGPYAWLGEAYATLTANLASHFGSWTAHPVGSYTQGELEGYSGVVYVGSTYDEPVPVAFLDDVLATRKPVIWAYDNIWQLTARQTATGGDFAAARGFAWREFDFSAIGEVRYQGTSLTRDASNAAGVMATSITNPRLARPVAEAVRGDGTTLPWAVRSGNLTYVSEIPFAYLTHDDRYLAFADLLFDALAPETAARHRALVRIEDVGPDSDPAELRAIADYLASERVPFTVAVYTRYRDPKGVNSGGTPEDYTLWQRPMVVNALRYMIARGGTLLMHGYTHQFSNVQNPYNGVSGDDFEFYAAHVDAADRVVYDGPVPGDSEAWARSRVAASGTQFLLAGLPQPTMFEFPHYAGSVADYKAVASRFATRYDRGVYFPGSLSGTTPDYSRVVGQFFPYAVRDVYGSAVVPENIGNVEPESYNTHPARLPADLIASARRNLVVRDGVASFFYHPYLGIQYLKQVVDGVTGLGYTFVPAAATLAR